MVESERQTFQTTDAVMKYGHFQLPIGTKLKKVVFEAYTYPSANGEYNAFSVSTKKLSGAFTSSTNGVIMCDRYGFVMAVDGLAFSKSRFEYNMDGRELIDKDLYLNIYNSIGASCECAVEVVYYLPKKK